MSLSKGMNGQSEQVRGQFHSSRMLETWKRVGEFVCLTLGCGSLCQTNMRGISRRVSTQVRNSDEYALGRQSGQDQTGQSRDSMNNRESEAR